MKKELKIQPTDFTPYIELRPGYCKIEGRAILEDSIYFFTPILQWIEEYTKDPLDQTTVVIDMHIYDSAVNRRLIEFFNFLEKIVRDGKEVKVIWYYDSEDTLSLQKGYEFFTVYNLTFDFIAKKYKK